MFFLYAVKEFVNSKMPQLPGPSRIPTFGTKIPLRGLPTKQKQEDELPISSADVGKLVLAAGKVGTLRFIGNVHFASGVWCGVELETDVGKNDGCIDGIRYFKCSRGRGLMTPLSKVALLNAGGSKHRISESKSSDSVCSISQGTASFIAKPDCTLTSEEPNGTEQDRIQPRIFYTQNVLNRERTYETIERRNLRPRDLDTRNDNNATKSEVDSRKRNKERISYDENIQGQYTPSNITSQSKRLQSCDSLLHIETQNRIGSPKIQSCAEHFDHISCQMNGSFQELKTKSDEEFIPLAKSHTITKISSLLLDNKEKSKETTFSRPSCSSSEEKDQSADNSGLRTFIFNSQEEENKRDSLDLDESLEILSTSQMNDGFSTGDSLFVLDDMPGPKNICQSPLPSPNFDLILQENVTLISDTTINLDLTLDTVDKSKNFGFPRLEETPSPEELPLDPIPIVGIEPKSETTKSKTNSFITSITSITSLDTGYQGDGEMSRPGSRCADNSPLTRRPLQRPPPRRTDAMTDSDFFTESDADNHDENVLKGDRKAQVIDGTLYGVDPQAAADIYVNNRENMDSSGIFTDIESNTRAEELLSEEKIDISPTDTSSKTLSENSQTNLQEVIAKNLANNEAKKKETLGENPKKRGNQSPVISNDSSTASPRHLQRDDSAKKYKTLKRDVQSKVKMLLETNVTKVEKKTLKKPAGRWDAVMNKISKSDSKTNFQEVKSRVNSSPNLPNDTKKVSNIRPVNSQKSPNNKLRRIRTRVLSSPNPSKNSNGESAHSSLSDLSSSLPKKPTGPVKKRETLQVNQVLTTNKLSPKLPAQTPLSDGKRRNTTPQPATASKAKKGLFPPKEKKQLSNKENGRSTVKGGRTSPVIKSPTLTRSSCKPTPKTAEALAVLVQHLVFNVEAFEVPHLRRQVKKFQLETEEIQLAYHRLEQKLLEEKQKNAASIEDERMRWKENLANLIESHRDEISKITNQKRETEENLLDQNERSKSELRLQYEEKLNTLKREFEKLQRTHEESLDILREENEAIREDIDAKNEEIRDAKREKADLKKEYETKETFLKEQIQMLSRDNQKFKQELASCKEEISKLEEERARLLEDNKRLLSYGEGKGVGVQEVESLRVVLELKQNEVSDLRKSLAEATQKAEHLANCEEKAGFLQARCEDLQLQLQRKNDYELMLISENKKLEQSFQEETNQRRSLALRNEELQWKLKQNKEVITKILEQTSDDVFNKSGHLSSSFNNDRYSSNTSLNISFKGFCSSPKTTENSRKLKITKSSIEDDSPPASPKIKGVVEKSDSVSYVLDLDESPEVVASRLVRRSFRNQKNTPTKSPCNKRPRMKGSSPLSQSSSASSLVSPSKAEFNRSRSVSIRNGDEDFQDDFNFSDTSGTPSPYHYSNVKLDESPECQKKNDRDLDYLDDHVLDLTLPALPSELGCKRGVQSLPRPKHLAGEAMVSESNSEDESTSSSSGQL